MRVRGTRHAAAGIRRTPSLHCVRTSKVFTFLRSRMHSALKNLHTQPLPFLDRGRLARFAPPQTKPSHFVSMGVLSMTLIVRTFRRALTLATLVAMLAACGGGSDSAAGSSTGGSSGDTGGSGGGGGTAAIEGVATPSSVSVVTATNAN